MATTTNKSTFGSARRSLGNHFVTVRVSDGELAVAASCTITETRPLNDNPSVSCSPEKSEVMTGKRARITAHDGIYAVDLSKLAQFSLPASPP